MFTFHGWIVWTDIEVFSAREKYFEKKSVFRESAISRDSPEQQKLLLLLACMYEDTLLGYCPRRHPPSPRINVEVGSAQSKCTARACMRSSTLTRREAGGRRGQYQGEYPHASKQKQLLLLWGIPGKSHIPKNKFFFLTTVREQEKLLYVFKRFTHGMRTSPADLNSAHTRASKFARLQNSEKYRYN